MTNIEEELLKKYDFIISLGFFCGVSTELDRIGLRDFSGPFDWVISSWDGIMKCLENDFCDLLEINNLEQYSNEPSYFIDTNYEISFFHDFNEYLSLEEQIEKVKEKYLRRIKRFKKNIEHSTLFIRYIKDQEEAFKIENNHSYIKKLLKSFNPENEIIFIVNNGVCLRGIEAYFVDKDDGDSVARSFLEVNKELKNYLCSDIYGEEKRVDNIKNYRKKKRIKKLMKYPKKIERILNKKFLRSKKHSKVYFVSEE